MVKVILGLVLAVFLLTPAYAQHQKSPDQIIEQMTTDLKLTPEQVKAVKPILDASAAKRQALLNSTQDKGTIKDQMKQVKQEEEMKLSQVLTPDQMTKMNDLKKQNKKGTGKGGKPGRG